MKKILSTLLMLSLLAGLMGACGATGGSSAAATVGSSEASQVQTQSSAAAATDGGAAESKWPEKAIQVIVPFKAGGDTDFNARICATKLEQKLGVPVVVVNVNGGGGSVGTRQVKDAKPDGYTLLFNQTPFLITMVNGMIDFGFEAFELAGVVGENPGYVYCVSSKLGVSNLKELIELSNQPGKDLKVAMNIGGTTQIFAYMLEKIGVKCTQVDIAGANDKAVACIGGHVDIIALPYGNVKQYVDSGDLVALALAAENRSPFAKDIPTAKEQGYDIAFPSRYFFAFPKGTDAAIVAKLSAALKDIIENDKEYAKSIADSYQQEPLFMDPKEALPFYEKQYEMIKDYKFQ